jgi:hypothetical protein
LGFHRSILRFERCYEALPIYEAVTEFAVVADGDDRWVMGLVLRHRPRKYCRLTHVVWVADVVHVSSAGGRRVPLSIPGCARCSLMGAGKPGISRITLMPAASILSMTLSNPLELKLTLRWLE